MTTESLAVNRRSPRPSRSTATPVWLIGVALAILLSACSKSSPVAPGTAANVVVSSMTVTAQARSGGGYSYGVIAHLRETAGSQATIASADLTFLAGTVTVATLHQDRPISDTANICPASGAADTRQLTAVDADASHPAATTVQATITFTDALSHTGTATMTADVPSIAPPPPPPTFTLAGVVSDDRTGQGIPDGNMQVLDGPNAGRASSTDSNGYYSIPALSTGSFTVHASAAGYEARDEGLTLASDTRVDLKLHRIAAPPPPPPPPDCAYTISPTTQSVSGFGGQFTATIARTSGTCGWQARSSDARMISFRSATSGNGSGVLTYSVATQEGIDPRPARTGAIIIDWSGGSVQLTVNQASYGPPPCRATIGPSVTVPLTPSTGQTFSVNFTATADPDCFWTLSTSESWIHLGGSGIGGGFGTITFTVDPLSSGTRTGHIDLRTPVFGGVSSSTTVIQQ
jgi:hypothetical protein